MFLQDACHPGPHDATICASRTFAVNWWDGHTGLVWTLNPTISLVSFQEDERTQRETHWRPCEGGDRLGFCYRNSNHISSPRSSKEQGRIFPSACRGSLALLTTCFQTSNLQNWEAITSFVLSLLLCSTWIHQPYETNTPGIKFEKWNRTFSLCQHQQTQNT